MKAYSRSHTHIRSLSIFPSPNVSLAPPGGLIEPAGRHGSFSIDRPAESLIPFPMAFITTLRFLELSACADFLTCTANIRAWKGTARQWIEYCNWAAKNLLTVMNYSPSVTRHVTHADQITYTSKNKRHCLGWTQFAAAINKVAKGNWVIIIYSNTIYVAKKRPGPANGHHKCLFPTDVGVNLEFKAGMYSMQN